MRWTSFTFLFHFSRAYTLGLIGFFVLPFSVLLKKNSWTANACCRTWILGKKHGSKDVKHDVWVQLINKGKMRLRVLPKIYRHVGIHLSKDSKFMLLLDSYDSESHCLQFSWLFGLSVSLLQVFCLALMHLLFHISPM